MSKRSKPNRVLVIRKPETDFSWQAFGHVKGFVSHQSDTKPYETELYADHASNIELNTQCSNGNSGWYGFDVSWDSHHRMNAYECRKALKVLQPIERKLAKLYEMHGACDIGQWFGRVAIAIGATQIVIHDEASRTVSGDPYKKYGRRDFALAIARINKLADETLAQVSARAVA